MTGKELIEKVLRNEEVERVPWVPYAGVHAGKLLGYKTGEVYTDEDKLVESLLEVNKLYKPDGQPVMFDLQIEAEILGCKLVWKDGAHQQSAAIRCPRLTKSQLISQGLMKAGCRWL